MDKALIKETFPDPQILPLEKGDKFIDLHFERDEALEGHVKNNLLMRGINL